MEIRRCDWITPDVPAGDICPVFRRAFAVEKDLVRAELQITALGVYEAVLNGRRVGEYVLAPGWTSYARRLQVQTYDITDLLAGENDLRVTVGRGWFRSPMPGWNTRDKQQRTEQPCGLIALITLVYADGRRETLSTGEDWRWSESEIRFSELYDGEAFDARLAGDACRVWRPVRRLDWSREILTPQEGEEIREQERLPAVAILTTPAGETVVDFGQEITGYVEFTVTAAPGEEVRFDHGEMLDREGNFYNENYRRARAEVRYVCREGAQRWHPRLTFFGFRYIRLKAWPGEPRPEQFTAVAVYSAMARTGQITTGDPLLNRLLDNILWSQRGNFLDVPTDCPQRDERLGWTGDAQAFVKAACCFYDTERFFTKWLRDLRAEQRPDGGVGSVIPDLLPDDPPRAAWGDAAVICPWEVYQAYGNRALLAEQFDSMRRWVDCIGGMTRTPRLWTGCDQLGDWLALDAPEGTRKGASRDDFIASAFYAHAADLVVRAGRALGEDVTAYDTLHREITAAFRAAFPDCRTQTEHVLALAFHLAADEQAVADALAAMIRSEGTQLRTGFVGTPYLLHVLSDHGYGKLAWDLLLRREYPGWLYPVTRGATTVWEHWDGVRPDGSFWSATMNSFNHYAYGAVADWIFEKAAGLGHPEDKPGYAELRYAPLPDPRVGRLQVQLHTRHGTVRAAWRWEDGIVCCELETPVPCEACIAGEKHRLPPGRHTFRAAMPG
ncbi:MAG: family 78 glycoside hydrolase catalytic domain [Clostridia bacterium]|nr:family 78 glycoside hydrolase catalytic domain [Clostridia bacterium]